jgi:hypothetical protein
MSATKAASSTCASYDSAMTSFLAFIGALAVLWIAYAVGAVVGVRRALARRAEEFRAAQRPLIELYRLHGEEQEAWTRYAHARERWSTACWKAQGGERGGLLEELRAMQALERVAVVRHVDTRDAIEAVRRAYGEFMLPTDSTADASSRAQRLATLDADHRDNERYLLEVDSSPA